MPDKADMLIFLQKNLRKAVNNFFSFCYVKHNIYFIYVYIFLGCWKKRVGHFAADIILLCS